MYTITKGELWLIRKALEDKDSEETADALSVVNSILDKNVTIEITEEQMLNEEPEEHHDEQGYSDLDIDDIELDLEEESRVC